jgi:hypothetical protein
VAAPAALAFENMLEGRPMQHTIAAAGPTISLALDSAGLLTMMSDNIVLARGLFCMLMAPDPTRPDWRAARMPANPGLALPAWRTPLEPVDKARFLRCAPILSRATVEQLLELVAVARDVELVEGSILCDASTADPVVYCVLQGEITIEREGAEPVVVQAGSAFGLAETLAGLPMPHRACVTKAGFALRLDQGPLLEVLTDHVDLLQGLFSGVLHLRRRE